MKFVLVLASFCCASAFGLHAATSSVKTLGYGVTNSNKPMVQPIDVYGGVMTTNTRGSMVRFRPDSSTAMRTCDIFCF
jgi:hypothetical protein